MAISKNTARQSVAAAYQSFELANFGDGLAQAAIQLPGGSVVVGGFLVVDQVFNAATTATLAIGDSLSATRYLAATDAKTAARTALTIPGYETLTRGDVIVTYAFTGAAATTGKARLVLQYIRSKKAEFTQG